MRSRNDYLLLLFLCPVLYSVVFLLGLLRTWRKSRTPLRLEFECEHSTSNRAPNKTTQGTDATNKSTVAKSANPAALTPDSPDWSRPQYGPAMVPSSSNNLDSIAGSSGDSLGPSPLSLAQQCPSDDEAAAKAARISDSQRTVSIERIVFELTGEAICRERAGLALLFHIETVGILYLSLHVYFVQKRDDRLRESGIGVLAGFSLFTLAVFRVVVWYLSCRTDYFPRYFNYYWKSNEDNSNTNHNDSEEREYYCYEFMQSWMATLLVFLFDGCFMVELCPWAFTVCPRKRVSLNHSRSCLFGMVSKQLLIDSYFLTMAKLHCLLVSLPSSVVCLLVLSVDRVYRSRLMALQTALFWGCVLLINVSAMVLTMYVEDSSHLLSEDEVRNRFEELSLSEDSRSGGGAGSSSRSASSSPSSASPSASSPSSSSSQSAMNERIDGQTVDERSVIKKKPLVPMNHHNSNTEVESIERDEPYQQRRPSDLDENDKYDGDDDESAVSLGEAKSIPAVASSKAIRDNTGNTDQRVRFTQSLNTLKEEQRLPEEMDDFAVSKGGGSSRTKSDQLSSTDEASNLATQMLKSDSVINCHIPRFLNDRIARADLIYRLTFIMPTMVLYALLVQLWFLVVRLLGRLMYFQWMSIELSWMLAMFLTLVTMVLPNALYAIELVDENMNLFQELVFLKPWHIRQKRLKLRPETQTSSSPFSPTTPTLLEEHSMSDEDENHMMDSSIEVTASQRFKQVAKANLEAAKNKSDVTRRDRAQSRTKSSNSRSDGAKSSDGGRAHSAPAPGSVQSALVDVDFAVTSTETASGMTSPIPVPGSQKSSEPDRSMNQNNDHRDDPVLKPFYDQTHRFDHESAIHESCQRRLTKNVPASASLLMDTWDAVWLGFVGFPRFSLPYTHLPSCLIGKVTVVDCLDEDSDRDCVWRWFIRNIVQFIDHQRYKLHVWAESFVDRELFGPNILDRSRNDGRDSPPTATDIEAGGTPNPTENREHSSRSKSGSHSMSDSGESRGSYSESRSVDRRQIFEDWLRGMSNDSNNKLSEDEEEENYDFYAYFVLFQYSIDYLAQECVVLVSIGIVVMALEVINTSEDLTKMILSLTRVTLCVGISVLCAVVLAPFSLRQLKGAISRDAASRRKGDSPSMLVQPSESMRTQLVQSNDQYSADKGDAMDALPTKLGLMSEQQMKIDGAFRFLCEWKDQICGSIGTMTMARSRVIHPSSGSSGSSLMVNAALEQHSAHQHSGNQLMNLSFDDMKTPSPMQQSREVSNDDDNFLYELHNVVSEALLRQLFDHIDPVAVSLLNNDDFEIDAQFTELDHIHTSYTLRISFHLCGKMNQRKSIMASMLHALQSGDYFTFRRCFKMCEYIDSNFKMPNQQFVSPLIYAAIMQRHQFMAPLLRRNGSVDELCRYATCRGDVETLRYVNEHCPFVMLDSMVDRSGELLMFSAIERGHSDVVEYLINSCGCDVRSILNLNEEGPCTVAASKGHANVLKVLYNLGGKTTTEFTAADEFGNNLAHLAAQHYGGLKVFEFLLETFGPASRVVDDHYYNETASTRTDRVDSAEAVVTHISGIQSEMTQIRTRFASDVTEDLNINDFPWDARNDRGQTPLYVACAAKHHNNVAFLCDSVLCNPNIPDTKGVTPLVIAASKDCGSIVRHLCSSKGLSREAINEGGPEDGQTAMHVAAMGGCTAAIRVLLEYGADINARDTEGCTPLMLACDMNGELESVRCLIEHDCEVNAQDNDGETALMKACFGEQPSHLDIVRTLCKCESIELDITENEGNSALLFSVGAQNIEMFFVIWRAICMRKSLLNDEDKLRYLRDHRNEEGSNAITFIYDNRLNSGVEYLKSIGYDSSH